MENSLTRFPRWRSDICIRRIVHLPFSCEMLVVHQLIDVLHTARALVVYEEAEL